MAYVWLTPPPPTPRAWIVSRPFLFAPNPLLRERALTRSEISGPRALTPPPRRWANRFRPSSRIRKEVLLASRIEGIQATPPSCRRRPTGWQICLVASGNSFTTRRKICRLWSGSRWPEPADRRAIDDYDTFTGERRSGHAPNLRACGEGSMTPRLLARDAVERAFGYPCP